MSEWKLKRVKILDRYTVEQSNKYDLKLYIEVEKGVWPFKKVVKTEIYRSNSVWSLTNTRWKTASGYITCCFDYHLPDGSRLNFDIGFVVNRRFEKIYHKRYYRQQQLERLAKIEGIKK